MFIRAKHFESEEEIKSEIEKWILSLSENFFKEGIGSKYRIRGGYILNKRMSSI
jgi:hypothetical protein